ncbi:MAG: DUF1573 domain-containing protein [Planctomycetota bacterium]
MRRKYLAPVCFIACCSLLWLGGCRSQVKSQPEPAPLSASDEAPASSGAAPKITFAKSVHDFGVVPPNKPYKADIKFTNTGDGILKISKVSKCCGVVTKLAGNKTKYEPGESGAVLIEWRSGSQPTLFKKDFKVHSNDKTNPTVTLEIRAKVALKVTWAPKRMRLFLDEDNVGGQDITIKSVDGRPFSITSFKSTGDCITADFDPSVEATKFVLEPKVNASKLHQNLKGRILIGLTHPDGNAAIILFDVLAKYTMDPVLFLFFYAEPGKPIVRKMTVLNNYKQDFAVESLSSKTGTVGVRVLSTRKLTDGYQLEVEVTPPTPASKGQIKVLDEFVLTLGDGEQIPIKCNLYYTKKTKSTTTTKTK